MVGLEKIIIGIELRLKLRRMLIVKFIIYFVIATIPLLFAAIQSWIWSFYVVCIFGAFLLLLWHPRSHQSGVTGKIFFITIAAFFVATLFQCLPMPQDILSLLSSNRFKELSNSLSIIYNQTGWQSISYASLNSLGWWTFLLSLLIFFLILRKAFDSTIKLNIIAGIMLGVAAVESLYGILQALIPSMGVLWVDYIEQYEGNARGTYINRNHFAGFIEMIWPLGLGITLAQGNWQRKLRIKDLLDSDRPYLQFLISTIMVFMLLALLFSRSRAGITGAFVGFITFVLLMRSANKGLPLSFWLMIFAVIGLISFYSSQMGFESILDRFFRVSTDTSRLDFWRDSFAIIKEHPLGTGLGTFKQVFPVYKFSSLTEKHVTYAHNDYLQLLVEAGWIGFLALVGGFAVFMVKSIRKVKRLHIPDDPLRFFLAVGALSGLVSIAFHSFFDFNLQIPANCVYFVTLIAIVDICLWSTDSEKGKDSSADYADFRRLRALKNKLIRRLR